MNENNNYLSVNRESWNQRTGHHVDSDFYDVRGFVKGGSSLNEIELALLGDIKDKSVLHLQCHFGQDSLSLCRMGAQVTGVDLSNRAIEEANKLSRKTSLPATFICCDVYSLPDHLDKKFDIIFTSYGTIGWLPDLGKWAKIVQRYLKPGGQFIMAEFHPVVWMYDDDFTIAQYRYFNSGPIVEKVSGTYTDRNAPIEQETITWNHGISEVLNSLIQRGMEISQFNEFDYSPYNVFNNCVKVDEKKYRIAHLENKIPMTYSILATKKR